MARKAKPAKAPARRRSAAWPMLCVGLVLSLWAAPLASLIAWLLAPAIGCRLVVRDAALSRVLLVFGTATLAHPVARLWPNVDDWATALSLAADAGTLAVCWGAQATAWLLMEVMPVLLLSVLDAQSSTKAAKLRDARSALQAEWGIPEG